MNATACDKISEALEQGVSTGRETRLDGALAEHARSCTSCSDATGIAASLRQSAREEPPRAGLASASHLWWRAQIIRQLVAEDSSVERATRSVRWTQAIAFGLMGVALIFGLSWLTTDLAGDLEIHASSGEASWTWLMTLLLAGTGVPLAGFAVLWLAWREL